MAATTGRVFVSIGWRLLVGCLRRLFLVGTVIVQFAAFIWALIVFGSAGVLGGAAVIAAGDALVGFILAAIAAVLTLIQVIVLWQGGRVQRRMAAELSRRSTVVGR